MDLTTGWTFQEINLAGCKTLFAFSEAKTELAEEEGRKAEAGFREYREMLEAYGGAHI